MVNDEFYVNLVCNYIAADLFSGHTLPEKCIDVVKVVSPLEQHSTLCMYRQPRSGVMGV